MTRAPGRRSWAHHARRRAGELGTCAVVLAFLLTIVPRAARTDPGPLDEPSGPVVVELGTGHGDDPADAAAAGGEPGAAVRSRLLLGATHTRISLDSGGDADALASAARVLADATVIQAQHVMGWGALSPEPAPGRYDWTTLDRRVDLMRRAGGQLVLTLCCAPDWMKGGAAGTTDWTRLEVAPDAAHVDDFAALAAAVAERYPDVHHFQVWNELKGFWDVDANNWDMASYMALYNAVHREVKRVRPDALLGGPYVPITSFGSASVASHPSGLRGEWGVVDQRALDAVEHFLAHADGADFLVVDGATSTRSGELPTDPFTANEKLEVVTRWIGERTDLPIWWAEYYPQPPGGTWTAQQQAAVHADAVIRLASAGAAAVFLWEPQASSPAPGRAVLWSDPTVAGGGAASPTALAYQDVQAVLGSGRRLLDVVTTGPITAAASDVGVVVVNRGSRARTVQLGARSIRLTGWQVRALTNGE